MATITVCDVCESRNFVHKLILPYARNIDSTGNAETIGEAYDLCNKCELNALKLFVKSLDEFDMNRKLIKIIEDMKDGEMNDRFDVNDKLKKMEVCM
jgi:hypothetical protein